MPAIYGFPSSSSSTAQRAGARRTVGDDRGGDVPAAGRSASRARPRRSDGRARSGRPRRAATCARRRRGRPRRSAARSARAKPATSSSADGDARAAASRDRRARVDRPQATLKQAMLGVGRHSTTANGPGGIVPVDVDRPLGDDRARRAAVDAVTADRRRGRCRHGDARRAAGERVGVEAPVGERRRDPVDDGVGHRLVEVRAEAQQVGAGGERAHRGVGDAVDAAATGDGLHVERVGDDHAVEAHRLAEVRGPRRAQRHRRVVERVGDDVGGEHRVDAGVDRRGERHQLAARQHVHRRVDARRAEVGVGAGVAVTGEVLGARGRRRRRGSPSTAATTWRATTLGRRAERAHADHRVARVGVDVGDRRQREVDAQPRRGVRPSSANAAVVSVDVVDEAERRRARRVAAPRRVEAGDVAALLVDGDRRRRREPRAARRTASATCSSSTTFWANSSTPPSPSRDAVEQPRRRLGPLERPEQHAGARRRSPASLIPSPPRR